MHSYEVNILSLSIFICEMENDQSLIFVVKIKENICKALP